MGVFRLRSPVDFGREETKSKTQETSDFPMGKPQDASPEQPKSDGTSARANHRASEEQETMDISCGSDENVAPANQFADMAFLIPPPK